MLQAIRRAAVEHLAGAPLPEGTDERSEHWRHLRQCIVTPVTVLDRVALWVLRLTTLLDLDLDLPDPLPHGVVVDTSGVARLARTGVRLVPVAVLSMCSDRRTRRSPIHSRDAFCASAGPGGRARS